jgi:hypothetical protein
MPPGFRTYDPLEDEGGPIKVYTNFKEAEKQSKARVAREEQALENAQVIIANTSDSGGADLTDSLILDARELPEYVRNNGKAVKNAVQKTYKNGFPTSDSKPKRKAKAKAIADKRKVNQIIDIEPEPVDPAVYPVVPAVIPPAVIRRAAASVQPDIAEFLDTLGLGFISVKDTPPVQTVLLQFSGTGYFTVPIPCHTIILTDTLVVLVIDTRYAPNAGEHVSVAANGFTLHLNTPDGLHIPVLLPVPRICSFNIGVLTCLLFVKIPDSNSADNSAPDANEN